MNADKNDLSAVWASVAEKTLLMEAAGLMILSHDTDGRKYLRPIIALACTLALCLLPMVSAGEEAYTVVARLAW